MRENSISLAKEVRTLAPSKEDLHTVYDEKYGNKQDIGWGPKLRSSFDYFTPDDYYEAVIMNLAKDNFSWVDIGCGHNIFPSNPELAIKLAQKAGFLLGIDPDENINDNLLLTEKFKGTIDEYNPKRKFDLITLRMVAEHIVNPDLTLEGIKKLAESGSLVVIYTPNKWAPSSILARYTPISVHHFFKKILWDTDERDTFPVQFRMNTREKLKALFQSKGFDEVYFTNLDDCRFFSKIYMLKYAELIFWRILKSLRIRYPESCLLGIYIMR